MTGPDHVDDMLNSAAGNLWVAWRLDEVVSSAIEPREREAAAIAATPLAALSIEIALKAVLEDEGMNPDRSHNLLDLWKQLPECRRETINALEGQGESEPFRPLRRHSIEHVLGLPGHQTAFTHWRYRYEHPDPDGRGRVDWDSSNATDPLALMRVAHTILRHMQCDWWQDSTRQI